VLVIRNSQALSSTYEVEELYDRDSEERPLDAEEEVDQVEAEGDEIPSAEAKQVIISFGYLFLQQRCLTIELLQSSPRLDFAATDLEGSDPTQSAHATSEEVC